MSFTVYLSGEIHTDWRDEIKRGAEAAGLDVVFTSAVTDHEASDAAGDCLGAELNAFWRDHKSSKVNAIRTKTLIQQADLALATSTSNGTPLSMLATAPRWTSLTSLCTAKTSCTR